MVNKLSNIKDRVLQVSKYKGIAYEKFCENIGMTYGSFKGRAKERPLNSDAVAIIISKYPEVNAEWLLTGVGNMLKVSSAVTQVSVDTTDDLFPPNTNEDVGRSLELLIKNKYLQKRIIDLESTNKRLEKELELKNELLRSFNEGRISYISSSENKGEREGV